LQILKHVIVIKILLRIFSVKLEVMRFVIQIQHLNNLKILSLHYILVSNMKSVSIVSGNCEATKDSFMLSCLEKYLEDNLSNVEVSDDNEPHEMFTNVVVREESSKEFFKFR